MNTSNIIHICIKSEKEVMHRDEDDYRCGISKMALAAYRTQTIIYAYALMSTHIHIVLETRNCSKFISCFRNGYTKWFNSKYKRDGRLGEKSFHTEYLGTFNRTLSAINYVLRNPVHHLVTDTALGYEFCSARYVFVGQVCPGEATSRYRMSRYYSHNIALPKSMTLNEKGMISPLSFLDIKAVERIYATPKNFLFHINRPSYADLEKSAGTNGEKVLSICDIEPTMSLEEIQNNERKRSVQGLTTDIDVCRIIDKEILSVRTYAQLTQQEKKMLADRLFRKFKYLSKKQIARCVGL